MNEHSCRKLFYTGPVINAELLVVMLEKHGIAATQELDGGAGEESDDFGREARVFVPENDFVLARRLFYTEREDEL